MGTVARSMENLKKCICIKCPSYSFACKVKGLPANFMGLIEGVAKAEHMEGMFCAFSQSKCIDTEKGCICRTCALYQENSLDKMYFCLATGGR